MEDPWEEDWFPTICGNNFGCNLSQEGYCLKKLWWESLLSQRLEHCFLQRSCSPYQWKPALQQLFLCIQGSAVGFLPFLEDSTFTKQNLWWESTFSQKMMESSTLTEMLVHSFSSLNILNTNWKWFLDGYFCEILVGRFFKKTFSQKQKPLMRW